MGSAFMTNNKSNFHGSQILVLGNYQNQNLGDEAIGLGLKKIFSDSVPYPLDVKLERFNIALSRSNVNLLQLAKDNIKSYKVGKLLQRFYYYMRLTPLFRILREIIFFTFINYKHWLKSYHLIRSSDVTVIGGGNLMMDLGYVNPVSFFIYTLFARILHKKIFISAIGCGPVSNSFSKVIFSWCLSQSDCISVRDTYSYRVLNSFCTDQIIQNVHLTADPAIVLDASDIPPGRPNIDENLPEQITIGISTLSYQDPRYYPQGNLDRYRNYINRISILADELSLRLSASIILFPTNINADLATASDIFAQIERPAEARIANITSLQDLMDTIGETDLILATRLHSAILAIGRGKPVIGFAYQEKMNSFFELMNLEEWVHSIEDFSSDQIVEQAKLLTSFEGRTYTETVNIMRRRLQQEAYKNGLFMRNLLLNETQ